ncbi:hypothetical protein FUAX_55360 (plasmid) [Fulvitalea axinellae]|uniref:Uncharacterized protein n=1 Tax=Fulvitalea axinellae TaxID=1182444 RepID=A0AAU9D3E8_9BACT|nr:hypothetical protein FUAX_55360 [Fulvitalea axinellae]
MVPFQFSSHLLAETWGTDTLTYVSTIYNACMSESETDLEHEIKLRAYSENLAPEYWQSRMKNGNNHQIPDRIGWNAIRNRHKDELKQIAYNFFASIFQAQNAESWEEVELMVSPKFMQEFFADNPSMIFKKDNRKNKSEEGLKASGKWLKQFVEELILNDTTFSKSIVEDKFISAFEKYVLFNLYIKREEYGFEYLNTK